MTNEFDCEATVRRLWPFLDGVLPPSELAAVVRHLEGCVNCTSHMDYAREFLHAVQAAGARLEDHGPIRSRVLTALVTEGFHSHAG
jgi:anti-sigma factor RsiW